MSNPEDTTSETPENIAPMAAAPMAAAPEPTPQPAHLFAKTVNDAVSAAQMSGVDQAQIYGILHFIGIQVEAPIRIIAHKNGQRMADHIMGR